MKEDIDDMLLTSRALYDKAQTLIDHIVRLARHMSVNAHPLTTDSQGYVKLREYLYGAEEALGVLLEETKLAESEIEMRKHDQSGA